MEFSINLVEMGWTDPAPLPVGESAAALRPQRRGKQAGRQERNKEWRERAGEGGRGRGDSKVTEIHR